MKFFDPKEEVLDLQLTPYGKRLLAKGKMKPLYYAFFDDDVLYDGKLGGVIEDQSSAQNRIKNATPRLKVQTVYDGVNTYAKTLSSQLDDPYQHQTLKESEHIMGLPLGESSLSGNVAPSWNIRLYHNEFTGSSFLQGISVPYLTSSGGTLRIPQMEIAIEPETYVSVTPLVTPKINALNNQYKDNSYPEMAEDIGPWSDAVHETMAKYSEGVEEINEAVFLDFDGGPYDDESVVLVKHDGAFIDLQEHNVDYLRENFDIEVYMMEEVRKADGTLLKETSQQLYFAPDDAEDLTPEMIEYWIDIHVDREIPDRAYCLLEVPRTKKQVPLDYLLGCPDIVPRDNVPMRNFYADSPEDEDIC